MQIKSQNLIPMQIKFSSGFGPKSAEVPSGACLSIVAKDDEQIIAGKQQIATTPKKILPSFCAGVNDVLILSDNSSWHDCSKLLGSIMDAIGGGERHPNFMLREDGTYGAEKAWQNFITGAVNAGEYKNEYIVLASKLAGKFGSGEKDLNAFTSFAAELSSEDLQTFMETYRSSPVTLTGEAGQAFMDFAADLSGNALKNFMIAVHNSPDDLQNIIATGSKLSEGGLSNFLTAASNAGEDVTRLTGQIDSILDNQQQVGESPDLSSYLVAAAKAGSLVIDFVEATKSTSPETTDHIANFISTRVTNLHTLKDFISLISNANEESINTIIDISSPLDQEDKSNLLNAASGAGKDLGQFVRSLTEFTSPGSGHSSTDFSNFLSTAAKAEGNLHVLMKLSGQLDLSFTSKLSTVDTINFLDAAEYAGEGLDKLTALGSQLAGNDKSNFFYMAAQAGDELRNFVDKASTLTVDQRSDFLLSSAQDGERDGYRAIYMKGILTTTEYANFQKSAAMGTAQQIDALAGLAGELEGPLRSDFLEIAAASKENVGELTTVFNRLSQKAQEDFLGLAKGLGELDLKNLISATGKTTAENSIDFIAQAKILKHSDKTGLGYFLSAAADASPNDLGSLISLVEKLGKEQSKLTNLLGLDMRHSFLLVASDAGHNLKGLIAMTEAVIPMGPENFSEIFNSAAAATGKYLGAFTQAYV